MRFSLLSLFGVMTAMALVLGVPIVLYALGGWIVLTAAAVVLLIAIFHLVREVGIDLFIGMLQRRRPLDEWNLPTNADSHRQLAERATEFREDASIQASTESTRNAANVGERE